MTARALAMYSRSLAGRQAREPGGGLRHAPKESRQRTTASTAGRLARPACAGCGGRDGWGLRHARVLADALRAERPADDRLLVGIGVGPCAHAKGPWRAAANPALPHPGARQGRPRAGRARVLARAPVESHRRPAGRQHLHEVRSLRGRRPTRSSIGGRSAATATTAARNATASRSPSSGSTAS